MRIASWNVNSVRARGERLIAWLSKHEPDVLCLQELKGVEAQFPHAEIQAAGYSAAICGQKTYNGVAILARSEVTNVCKGLDDGVDDPQARLVAASVAGIRVVNVYVPNGREVGSDAFAYKLQWLERLHGFVERHHRPDEPLVVCGDFNCAPDDRDVAEIEQWAGGVLTHDDVRSSLLRLKHWGLVDTLREHHAEGGLYSWWDYRRLGFPKNNGLRIDLVLATQALAQRCKGAWIDRDERKGHKPSDHAPVVAELD